MKPQSKTPPAPQRKRILVVDDHPLMREGVTQWIEHASDLEVCGTAESAAAALAQVEAVKPDLVITDISLTGRDGIELIKDLRALRPELPVLVLSMHEESLYAGRALRAGARGYLMKRTGGERVVEAIREVLRGCIAVSPALRAQFLEAYVGRRFDSDRGTLSNLTDREFEILQLVGEVKSSREIAEQLHISPKTVDTHRANLMRKLKLKNPGEVLRFALQYSEKGS